MLELFTMTNTPVSIGDLPAAGGSSRTQSGAGGSVGLFSGLFEAARAEDSGPPGIETPVMSGPEVPSPLAPEVSQEQPASVDPDAAAPVVVQEIEGGPLDITSELSLAYPNLPAAAGSSAPTHGKPVPATGAELPLSGQQMPVPGMGVPVAQPASPTVNPSAFEPLSAALATTAPSPTALQAAGSPVTGTSDPAVSLAAGSPAGSNGIPVTAASEGVLKAPLDPAGLPVTPTRDVPVQTVSSAATSAIAMKSDRTEATLAAAHRPASADPIADGARAAPTSSQPVAASAVSAASVVAATMPLSGELSAAPLRGVMELPPEARFLQAPGSPDSANVYTRTGRASGTGQTGAWENGLGARRGRSLGPTGNGSAISTGAPIASGSAQEGGLNPRTLAPLQTAFAAALVRPAALRPGSSAAAGTDSGTDPLTAALDATAADPSAESSLNSTSLPARTAEGVLRGEFARLDPVLGTQVTAQIARQIQQGMGSSNLHIKLNPSELGQVDVQLRMDGDRVHVAITTHQSATRDLIESHLSSLRTALENGGLSLGDVDVRHSSQGGAQGERGLPAGDRADQRGGRAAPADTPADAIPRALATEGSSGRSIDAFV